MEPLQKLTRRQLEALQTVHRLATGPARVSLLGVARSLRVSPPAALDHLRALERVGLVARRAGQSGLTPAGRRCLGEYERHHRIAERLFDNLHLSPQDTCEAAREIDLSLSHRTVERLCRAAGHPTRCPHELPIAPCGHPDAKR